MGNGYYYAYFCIANYVKQGDVLPPLLSILKSLYFLFQVATMLLDFEKKTMIAQGMNSTTVNRSPIAVGGRCRPKGSEFYLRLKTHIQHTHSEHLSTSTQTSTNNKNTHRNSMGQTEGDLPIRQS